jgi:cystathionine beta-lyase
MKQIFSGLTLSDLRAHTSEKWASYGSEVLPLWVAEMDVNPPPAVSETVSRVLAQGDTGYLSLIRAEAYLTAYSDFMFRHHNFRPDVSKAMVLTDVISSMKGIVQSYHYLQNPSATVDNTNNQISFAAPASVDSKANTTIVYSPPIYPPFIQRISWPFNQISVNLTEDYRLDLPALEKTFAQYPNAIYLLCNPQNPTGTVHTFTELSNLVRIANLHQVFIISDEIHFPLIRPGVSFTSLLEIPEFNLGAVCVSASKGFNLAGLKSALAIPPATSDFSVATVKTARKFFTGEGGGIGTVAHAAAFNEGDEWLAQLNQELAENEKLLAELLTTHFPEAKFQLGQATYLQWVDFSNYIRPGYGSIAEHFLRKNRVALTDGTPYGIKNAQNFARINFATHPDILTAAIQRLSQNL